MNICLRYHRNSFKECQTFLYLSINKVSMQIIIKSQQTHQKMSKKVITVIFSLIWLIIEVQCLTSPMSLSHNKKYVYTSTLTIPTSQTYNNASAINSTIQNFYVPFPTTLSNSTRSSVVISINNIKVDFLTNQTEFDTQLSNWNTYFIVDVISSMFQNFQVLAFRYLILTGNYSEVNNPNMFINRYFVTYNGVINSSLYVYSNLTFRKSINSTGSLKYYIYLNDFNLNSTTSLNLLDLQVLLFNATSTSIQIRFYSYSTIETYMKRVGFTLIVYNQQYYTQASFANFQSGFINQTVNSSRSIIYQNFNQVFNFSTMVGLNGFHAQGNLDMSISFQNPDNFTVSSQNHADYFSLFYILLSTFYCADSTPFYDSSTQMCYDQCPARTYADQTHLTCHVCQFDCLTCAVNGSCLSCSSTDYRYLFQTRCLPMPGYYESGVPITLKCSSGCSTCSSGSTCTGCFEGFTLKNSMCSPLEESSGLSGAIFFLIGLVIGVIVLAIVIFIIYKCRDKSKKKRQTSDSVASNNRPEDIIYQEQIYPQKKKKNIVESSVEDNPQILANTHENFKKKDTL